MQMTLNNKNDLLLAINQASFMADDIALFLNTNPHCDEALKAYKKYVALRHELISDYECKYSPIIRDNVDDKYEWSWINEPWPWEGACN